MAKPFDAVNHDILCNTLYRYGIKVIALKLFKDCLSDIKQRVLTNEHKSNHLNINTGVPLRTSLGPI